MSSLLDRLNQEIESLGRKAHAALDEGKLHLELLRFRREREEAASKLGLLVHRRERNGEVDALEVDALLVRLDGLDADVARIERAIAALKGEQVSVGEQPAPVATERAEAEIVEGS